MAGVTLIMNTARLVLRPTDVEAVRFTRHLESEVSHSLRLENRVAVLFAGVSGLAEIGVASGPLTRSGVLDDVVRSWHRLLRPDDALFHTGTDEFTLLCSQLTDPMPAMKLADALRDVTAGHVVVPFTQLRLTLSVTVAFMGG